MTPRPNYGITRIDQPEKKNHGYYVRITHNKRTQQKYFPDKSSGGKNKALKLARGYRDELLANMPQKKQRFAAQKKRKTLKSDVPGVTHVQSKATLKNNTVKVYDYFQSAWDEDGKRRTRKFKFNPRKKEEIESARTAAEKNQRSMMRKRKKKAATA